MKRIWLMLIVSVMCIALSFSIAQAAKKDAPKAAATKAKAAPAVVNPEEEMQKILAKKKAELNNTEWTIELTPMNNPKGNKITDMLRFVDDKISVKNMESLGFGSSNFTLRLQDDGTATWETMQTSAKEGVAFWRGDLLSETVMVGVLSKRDTKAKVSDYSFKSTVKTAITPPAAVVQAPPAAAVKAPEAQAQAAANTAVAAPETAVATDKQESAATK